MKISSDRDARVAEMWAKLCNNMPEWAESTFCDMCPFRNKKGRWPLCRTITAEMWGEAMTKLQPREIQWLREQAAKHGRI